MTKDNWAEVRAEAYREGYLAAKEDCIRIIRDKLGDRLVNNTWTPGSPLEAEIAGAIADRRPR